MWNDDETAFGQCPFFLNPEAAIFGNPIAQASCAADSIAATAGFSIDALFWCAGCQGSMYPRTLSVFGTCGGPYRRSTGEFAIDKPNACEIAPRRFSKRDIRKISTLQTVLGSDYSKDTI